VTSKIAPLLQSRDRSVASGLVTCVGNHDGPSPLAKNPPQARMTLETKDPGQRTYGPP
jgi:hypothetical protein